MEGVIEQGHLSGHSLPAKGGQLHTVTSAPAVRPRRPRQAGVSRPVERDWNFWRPRAIGELLKPKSCHSR